jgi:hypothetical protein
MQKSIKLDLFIDHSRQGEYFTLPFSMPDDVESLALSYRYPRHLEIETGTANFRGRQEANIIDLGLIAPDGRQVGASGSDKLDIIVREVDATPGYTPWSMTPGEWQILVGAYMVALEGVSVTYEITFTQKHRRLVKGDLHTHTLASDGVHTVEELGWKALRNGLDYVAITDHNQMISREALPCIQGVTLIPGVEWTHYQGHASFLGVDRPYDAPFATNTLDETRQRFESARERGALIIANHPFEEGCEFRYDLQDLPFDCLEIWNGPMRISNLQAVGLWQSLLVSGRKIPACGGSDYHRDTPFIFLGGPTTCIYTMSQGPSDILSALKNGHAFITFAPNGPTLDLYAGDAIVGETVSWDAVKNVEIRASGLIPGDVIKVVTGSSSEELLEVPAAGEYHGGYTLKSPGFARIEIWRAFLPGVPKLPALLSNPIYFE